MKLSFTGINAQMKTRQLKFLLLAGFCMVIVLHHFVGYLGHYGYDDMHYAKLAHDLSDGHFNPHDHFSFRITLLGLTSLSYRLFGVNDFASALPSMLISIGTLILVFFILQKEKPAIIAIGLSFVSLNFWGLFYSDKIMPDPFVTFFTFLGIFFIYAFKFRKHTFPTLFYAFAAALTLFLGFNTKGNIVLIFPLLAYFFITDLILKRDIKFWMIFSGSAVFLLFLYFVLYQLMYGNALVRFQAITANSYLNLCSYAEQPFVLTLKRIGYQLLFLFIGQALFTPFLFLLAKPKQLLNREVFLFNTEAGFFIVSAFILLLSSNFMTISTSGYSPMCLDPRHYLFIVPVAGIAATLKIKGHLRNKSFVLQTVLITALVFVVALIHNNNSSWLLYLPLALALLLWFAFLKNRFSLQLFAVLFFAVLLINPVQMALYAKKINFREQERILKETVFELDKPALILTNPVQKNIATYLNEFEDSEISFLSYDEFNTIDQVGNRPVYLFKNYYTRYLSNINEEQLPSYAKFTNDYKKLYENQKLNIQLFKIDTLTIATKIAEAKNDFEGEAANWSGFEPSDKYVYSGKYASRVGKYSSTFRIKPDTILTGNSQQLVISTSFQILLVKESELRFVISTESGFWKGIGFQNQIKAYGSWMPITISDVIDLKSISPDDVLVLYLFNDKEDEIYLDDFSIELSVLKQTKTQ